MKPGPNVPFPPVEALLVEELPVGDAWQYEPKWDGFRHGRTHGPPVNPLLCGCPHPAASVGSRRAKRGFAHEAAVSHRADELA
jgi:hypothetical protein